MICLDCLVCLVFFLLKVVVDIKLICFIRLEMLVLFILFVVLVFVFFFDFVLICFSLLGYCVLGFFLSLRCIGFEIWRDLEIYDFGLVLIKYLSVIFFVDF